MISIAKVYKLLKDELELSDYYGGNLDALWDCLTEVGDFPLKIMWNDYEYSKNKLGDFADKLMKLFF